MYSQNLNKVNNKNGSDKLEIVNDERQKNRNRWLYWEDLKNVKEIALVVIGM